jgi:deazaflavin-dependent oxidoreductase (nitroreductase family)
MSSVVVRDRVVIASRAPDLRMMRFFNPVIRALLRSPVHGLLSGQILLLTYTGRRSGRQYTLPVGYLRDGDALLVVSQHSELKQWWRNLRDGAPVTVLLRRERVSARADLIEDPEAVAAEVQRLIARLGPKEASRQLYMGLDVAPPPTQEQLAQALHGVVVVRITPSARDSKKEIECVKQPAH